MHVVMLGAKRSSWIPGGFYPARCPFPPSIVGRIDVNSTVVIEQQCDVTSRAAAAIGNAILVGITAYQRPDSAFAIHDLRC